MAEMTTEDGVWVKVGNGRCTGWILTKPTQKHLDDLAVMKAAADEIDAQVENNIKIQTKIQEIARPAAVAALKASGDLPPDFEE